jgi:hypothetical protein
LLVYLFFISLGFYPIDLLLLDYRGNEIKLVLWGARAREFEAEEVRIASESGAVIAIFVGTLPKTYRGHCLIYTSLSPLIALPS